jgi:hypothetical protein
MFPICPVRHNGMAVVQFEKKKVDYHLSKTELKNKYWINSNCNSFKIILFDISFIKIV